ncbi:DUF362 domain-containing protein [Halanaerobaculum tunisiense]
MKVSSVSCSKYQQELVTKQVKEALDLIGGIEEYVTAGDQVLVKPNLLSPHDPELGITTHPLVVRAVIHQVHKAGGQVIVGESSGGMMVNQSLTKKSFVETGTQQVCQELGVEVVNFDRVATEVVTAPQGEEIPLPQVLLAADVVISLPKLKTHSLTLFTGAIKNLYGCIPGMKKAEYHKLYPTPQDFASLIVDLYSLIQPDLAIMDGVIGLEGNGPGTTGVKCRIGSILASTDLVALDTLAASYLGYKSDQVPITRIASEQKLGTNQLEQIEVVGDFAAPNRDFNLPSNALLSILPEWLVGSVFNSLLSRPEVNQEDCVGCQLCLQSCPQEVIVEDGSQVKIKEEDCIKCLCCQELCPEEAITVTEHALVKAIRTLQGIWR